MRYSGSSNDGGTFSQTPPRCTARPSGKSAQMPEGPQVIEMTDEPIGPSSSSSQTQAEASGASRARNSFRGPGRVPHSQMSPLPGDTPPYRQRHSSSSSVPGRNCTTRRPSKAARRSGPTMTGRPSGPNDRPNAFPVANRCTVHAVGCAGSCPASRRATARPPCTHSRPSPSNPRLQKLPMASQSGSVSVAGITWNDRPSNRTSRSREQQNTVPSAARATPVTQVSGRPSSLVHHWIVKRPVGSSMDAACAAAGTRPATTQPTTAARRPPCRHRRRHAARRPRTIAAIPVRRGRSPAILGLSYPARDAQGGVADWGVVSMAALAGGRLRRNRRVPPAAAPASGTTSSVGSPFGTPPQAS